MSYAWMRSARPNSPWRQIGENGNLETLVKEVRVVETIATPPGLEEVLYLDNLFMIESSRKMDVRFSSHDGEVL